MKVNKISKFQILHSLWTYKTITQPCKICLIKHSNKWINYSPIMKYFANFLDVKCGESTKMLDIQSLSPKIRFLYFCQRLMVVAWGTCLHPVTVQLISISKLESFPYSQLRLTFYTVKVHLEWHPWNLLPVPHPHRRLTYSASFRNLSNTQAPAILYQSHLEHLSHQKLFLLTLIMCSLTVDSANFYVLHSRI